MSRTWNHVTSAEPWARRAALAMAIAGVAMLTFARHNAAAATLSRAARFHLALSRAEPGVNDTVKTSPPAIRLWFTESVEAASTAVRVTGPLDQAVAIGAVTVDAAPKAPAVVSVGETLKPGTYTVAWKAMASDGHPSSGKFTFTLRAASE